MIIINTIYVFVNQFIYSFPSFYIKKDTTFLPDLRVSLTCGLPFLIAQNKTKRTLFIPNLENYFAKLNNYKYRSNQKKCI